MTSLAHLLDDYLDTIDHLPADLKSTFAAIHSKSSEVSELHRTITRRRGLLLRSDRRLEESTRESLLRKVAREDVKLHQFVKEKAGLEGEVEKAVRRQLARLDGALRRSGVQVQLTEEHGGIVGDVPWPEMFCNECFAANKEVIQCTNCGVFSHAQCNHTCSK